jgi:release factor glutamine methyltransferase|tara:strand:- start:1738 stop:2565 length:828 start_codon:yes stop_codon:yes gene_type:complete
LSKNLTHYNNIIDNSFEAGSDVKKELVFYLKEKLFLKHKDIYLNKEKIFTDSEDILIENFIKKKQEGIPLDYILNSTKFYEEEFYVDERVLIPRPETELLVDYINNYDFPRKIKILDAGTGSGCIGISIATKNPKFEVYGSDYAINSLNVAKINKKNLDVANFHLIQADWLCCFDEKSFDVIISNPPYIAEEDPHLNDLKHEPYQALVASNHGLGDIQKITQQSTKILKREGMLIFEHGFNQSNDVKNIFEENGFTNIKLIKDFQNHPRATLGMI